MTWAPPAPHHSPPPPPPPQAPRPPSPSRAERQPGLDRSDIPAPLPGRPLWAIFGTILLLAGVPFGTFNVISLLAHEQHIATQTFAGADITTIDVGNDTGRVTITGTDREDIAVSAEISRGLRRTGFRQEVVGTTLELRGSCPIFGSEWCWVDYRIEVPRRLDVVVNADGRVIVADIDGDVRIDTDNGRATLASISGSLVVTSDNGRVEGTDLSGATADVSADNGRIDLQFASPPASVVADSDNGSIEIGLPASDDDYNIETSTDNGSEDVLVARDSDSIHHVRAQTDNGDIVIRPTE